MGMAVGAAKGIKNEINVTPLVDVVLVLLIIFMVITPMLQRGRDVHLPKARGDRQGRVEERSARPLRDTGSEDLGRDRGLRRATIEAKIATRDGAGAEQARPAQG